jgi:hypothetical protein
MTTGITSHIFDKKIIPPSRCNQIPQKSLRNKNEPRLKENVHFEISPQYKNNDYKLLTYDTKYL